MRGRWPRQGLSAPHPASRCEPLRVSRRETKQHILIDPGQTTRKKLGFPGFFHIFMSKMIWRPVRGGESVDGRLGQSTQVSPSVSLQSSLMTQFFPAELTLDIIGRDEEAELIQPVRSLHDRPRYRFLHPLRKFDKYVIGLGTHKTRIGFLEPIGKPPRHKKNTPQPLGHKAFPRKNRLPKTTLSFHPYHRDAEPEY